MNRVQILRVVVASPGDVQAERDLVARVVAELNRGIAADRGMRLEVVRWETDAYPGFTLDGPQRLIDTILNIEDSDIVVGIFWKRFGTSTYDAGSGTVHELEKAITSWKRTGRPHIMVYFNQREHAPRSVEEMRQWTQVLEFKEEFLEEALGWEYSGEYDFEEKLRNHLGQFILRGISSPPLPPPSNQVNWPSSLPPIDTFVELGSEAVRRRLTPGDPGVINKTIEEKKPLIEALHHILAAIKEVEEKFTGSYHRGRSTNIQDIIVVEVAGIIQPTIRLALDVQDILITHLRNIRDSPYSWRFCNVESDEGIAFCVSGAAYTWVLDPIDGSRHLARGSPLFTTSVALHRNDGKQDAPILGVIYAPVTKELFFAAEGCGAYLNDWSDPLIVSDAELHEAYVHVEFPNQHLLRADPEDFEKQAASVAKIFREAYRVRGLGLGTLGLAYVAKGTFDAYVTLTAPTLRNDVAAGTLLVREAGGQVKWVSTPTLVDSGVRVIAAGEKLMKELKEIVSL